MRILVNGKEHQAPQGSTLADLIAELGLDKSPCAAEVNKTLVPKRTHAEQTLHEGDQIELVTLVGGG